jgi:hypothetical protein
MIDLRSEYDAAICRSLASAAAIPFRKVRLSGPLDGANELSC